jgi:hypothetical protein
VALKISADDTPFSLAQRLLGDGRLTHELFIPHWDGKGKLPVGGRAFVKGEPVGPPAKNWTRTR